MTNSKESITKSKKANSDRQRDSRCCQTGCPDCPYGFQENFNPDIPIELQKKPTSKLSENIEKYLDIEHYKELDN